MKKIIPLLIFICYFFNGYAQSPLGEITLSTQQQVDDFSITFPNCTDLSGGLRIQGTDITNLNGLSQITQMNGLLLLDPSNLQSLNGLHNVTRINGISVLGCDMMTNLNGLNNLVHIGGQLQIEGNLNLTSLEGLEKVDSIMGQLFIYNNPLLESLLAFENLEYIQNNLIITICPQLTSCEANGICEHLNNMTGNPFIDFNGLGCDSIQDVEDACVNCVENNVWIGTSPGFWNDANNWSLNEIPTDCHQVIIEAGTEVIVPSNSTATAYTLEVKQGAIFKSEQNA